MFLINSGVPKRAMRCVNHTEKVSFKINISMFEVEPFSVSMSFVFYVPGLVTRSKVLRITRVVCP